MIPKNISPLKLIYYCIRGVGSMNQEGRPWSILYTIFHGALCTTMFSAATIDTFVENRPMSLKFISISITFTVLHILSKFFNILIHETEIRNLLDKIEIQRQQVLADPFNRHLAIEADIFIRKSIKFVLAFSLLFPFITTPLFLFNELSNPPDKRNLLFQMWFPWGHSNDLSFVLTALFQALLTLSTGPNFVVDGALILTLSYQFSVFAKVLQKDLKHFGSANKKRIIQRHIALLKLLQEYNRLFSGQIYLEIILSAVQPCGYSVMLIKMLKENNPKWIIFAYSSIYVIMVPFALCTCGQEISNQMGKLHECAYLSNWLEEKPANRKDLAMLMTLTTNTATMNYRRVFVFNLVCMAKMTKGIYSVITLIARFESMS